MKKIITLALAVLMIFAMSVSAFADDYLGNWDSANDAADATTNETGAQNVTITLNDQAEDPAKVYYVQVLWESLAFTYTFASNAVWNPENHQYEVDGNAANGTWSDAATVTMKNHSNDIVNVTVSQEDANTSDAVTIVLSTEDAQDIAAAVPGTRYEDASAVNVTIQPQGVPDVNTQDGTVIGTVKVTFAAGSAA